MNYKKVFGYCVLAFSVLGAATIFNYAPYRDPGFKKIDLPDKFNGIKSVRVGDVNNDGIKDIYCLDKDGVYCIQNKGNGKFLPKSLLLKKEGLEDFDVRDMNLDGLEDIIARNKEEGIIIWINPLKNQKLKTN